MTNKEHVIKDLEEAILFVDSRGYGGVAHTMHDALDMLKEQEDKMDMLEIAIQNDLDRFHMIPEQTGADDLLIDIYATMFEYMKELRKRISEEKENG